MINTAKGVDCNSLVLQHDEASTVEGHACATHVADFE
jgi:hypothetical protein